jgi:hypothetical protein
MRPVVIGHSLFRFLVTTGRCTLDPVVHGEMRDMRSAANLGEPIVCMDCRIKSGNDDMGDDMGN